MSAPTKKTRDGRFWLSPSLVIFSTALLLSPLFFVPLLSTLTIANPRTGETLWVRVISPGETFCLAYLHSVELSLVQDCFTVAPEGKFILFETRFDSSNAGLPVTLEKEEKLIFAPDGMRIINRRISLSILHLWVHEKSLNTLTMNSNNVSLPALAGNLLVELKISRLSPLRYLEGRFF